MTTHLDATGLLCPLPVLKLRKRLKTLNVGESVEMLADDPAAWVDVPHFCFENGHELCETKDLGNGLACYLIKKA